MTNLLAVYWRFVPCQDFKCWLSSQLWIITARVPAIYVVRKQTPSNKSGPVLLDLCPAILCRQYSEDEVPREDKQCTNHRNNGALVCTNFYHEKEKYYIFCSYIRIIWTNKMHYFLLIYFNIKPIHVSSRLFAHHQEDQLCINSNWYSHALCWLAAASSQST